ncbi:hypothetical protein COL82_09575 [Bacillus toyonensis]|uniref:phosphoribosyltransferase-like protein n=1 Tax=Bacillus toyonensis TaxID=155322 RepID=UPI000BFA0FC1|nr:hypothetical protein [Bacillus toyonensis]PFZ78743.1 hypothetical protein COL82_09575 [Bacillus toyonensis]
MLTDIDKINDVVNKWDLNEGQKQLKRKILEEWRTCVEDEAIFNDLIKICEGFTYYSERLTAEHYKEIYGEMKKSISNFEEFFDKSIFMPLRRKERMESAVDMFSNFRLANALDANKTYVDGPITFLTRYHRLCNDIQDQMEKHDSHVDKNNKIIAGLKKKLKYNWKDSKVKLKIQKKIEEIESLNKNYTNKLETEVRTFNDKYYHIKNIIIIDDFIGTGESVEKVINKIHEIINKYEIHIYLLVLEASASGEQYIKSLAEKKNININIFYSKKSIDVLEENVIFPSGYIISARKMVEEINKKFRLPKKPFCKNHAIASFVNAPNNNLVLLSSGSYSWKPIFLRTNRNENRKKEIDKKQLNDIMSSIKNLK